MTTQTGSFFEVVATGDWQPITMEADATKVLVAPKRNNGIYTNLLNPVEFHVSFNENGDASFPTTMFIHQVRMVTGDIAVYIKAPLGTTFSVAGVS